MTVLNDLDRFHLAMDVVNRVGRTGEKGIYLKQQLEDKLVEHRPIHQHAWPGHAGDPRLALEAVSTMPGLNILTLNSGSSSLKFGLYRVESSRIDVLLSGEDESTGGDKGTREALARITRRLSEARTPAPDAVGHRIVHGGPRLREHCLIDDAVLQLLEDAIPFAPLHNPSALSIIRSAREHFPDLPQVACFDTAFTQACPMSHVSFRYPGNCGQRAFNATGSMAFPANRSFATRGRPAGPPGHRPPRQWRERHSGERRQVDRYHHGIDAHRRGDHGHAQRRPRSRRAGVPHAREQA